MVECQIRQHIHRKPLCLGGIVTGYDLIAFLTHKCKKRHRDHTLRGMTALYDAIGTSVTDLEKSKGKEDKVLVTIITDGYENDSLEWDGASVKKLIDRLCKKGWVFTYIGANQDAALEAGKIGVKNSLTFEATIEGTVNMFAFEKQSRQRWNKRVRLNENDIQNDYFSDDDK